MTVRGRIYTFPPLTEETGANGMRMIWLPDNEQQAVTVALQLPFGKLADPPGREGLTELTVGLMQKGCESLTSDAFAEKLEFAGASLFSEVGEEFVILGCKFLSRFENEIVPLFWDMVRSPAFGAREFDLAKKEFLTSIQAEANDPGSIVGRHFHAQVFGTAHPAGRNHSTATVRSITGSMVREHYESWIRPDGATIVVAGAFGPDMAKWRTMFAGWKARPGSAFGVPQPAVRHVHRSIRLIDKPDLTQSTIVVGKIMPGETYERHNEIAIANYILGAGNFSSRLIREARTVMGKAYGISSQLMSLRGFGLLSIMTSTLNAQVGEMVDIIVRVCSLFRNDGITGEEFEKAKQFALGNLAFQLEGIPNVAEKLLWLRLYGRGNDYIERFGETLDSVSRDSIQTEIGAHFNLDEGPLTVIGNGRQVLPQLEKYGRVETVHYRAPIG